MAKITVNDMKIGDHLVIHHFKRHEFFPTVKIPYTFIKVSDKNDFLMMPESEKGLYPGGIGSFPMNQNLEKYGSVANFYPDSFANLILRVQTEGVDYLEPHEIICKVPRPLQYEKGEYVKVECLASIPSISEIFGEGFIMPNGKSWPDEGEKFQTDHYIKSLYDTRYISRSPYGNVGVYFHQYGSNGVNSQPARHDHFWEYRTPVRIRVKGDREVIRWHPSPMDNGGILYNLLDGQKDLVSSAIPRKKL